MFVAPPGHDAGLDPLDGLTVRLASRLAREFGLDPLGPMRGIVAGVALGLFGWSVLGGIAWLALRVV
jgi:hypothetical protein